MHALETRYTTVPCRRIRAQQSITGHGDTSAHTAIIGATGLLARVLVLTRVQAAHNMERFCTGSPDAGRLKLLPSHPGVEAFRGKLQMERIACSLR